MRVFFDWQWVSLDFNNGFWTYYQYLLIERRARDASCWKMGKQRSKTPQNQHGCLRFCPKPQMHMEAEEPEVREIYMWIKGRKNTENWYVQLLIMFLPRFSFCYTHHRKQYRILRDILDMQSDKQNDKPVHTLLYV